MNKTSHPNHIQNHQPASLDEAAEALTELDRLQLEAIQGGKDRDQAKALSPGPLLAYHY